MSEILSVSQHTIERDLSALKKMGVLIQVPFRSSICSSIFRDGLLVIIKKMTRRQFLWYANGYCYRLNG